MLRLKEDGGIAGFILGGGNGYALIENCYNVGSITSNAQYKGGILGSILSGTKDVSEFKNNYYLTGKGALNGIGNPTSNTNVSPKSETQLKSLSTTLGDKYINDDNGLNYNDGYPLLQWQITETWTNMTFGVIKE